MYSASQIDQHRTGIEISFDSLGIDWTDPNEFLYLRWGNIDNSPFDPQALANEGEVYTAFEQILKDVTGSISNVFSYNLNFEYYPAVDLDPPYIIWHSISVENLVVFNWLRLPMEDESVIRFFCFLPWFSQAYSNNLMPQIVTQYGYHPKVYYPLF